MPNLLDWLGGVAAEINPFDNGDNFNSYIKKRQQPQRPQPQPQQVVPQRIAPPQQLRPLGFTSPMPSPASVSRNSVTNQFNPLKALADISRPISQGGINGLADIGNAITNMAQHPVETATAVASGIQRVPAVVGDIDLQGRAVVGSLVDNLNPALTQEQRDINNLRRVQETEIVRNWLKSLKSLDGQSMIRQDDWNPTGDFVKDTGDLIGRSADVANSATTLINPTASFVKGAAGRTFMPVLKNTARDATFFGTLNGVQQGATTLGQTGDFGKAFADGTQAAGQAALMQGAMGLGGYAAGRGLSKATSTTKKATTATAKAVNESRPSVIAAQHPEIQQLDSHINMLQQQFDNEPNKLVRNQLNKAITVANNERRSVYSRALSQAKRAQEGGYAKIPNPDELFKKNAKNAYKVSDGQKYYTELSPAESDLKMPFTNDKYNELLHNKNHTDAVNQDFNKNLGYIKTLSNPDKIIKDAQSGRVNYVRELQGSNEGKVNRVGTKPVEQKGNQYLNTSFIQGGKRRNSKLLDGLAKPSSPVGDGASIPVLKSNSNVPQSKGNVNNYTKANKELKTAIDARINETNPELFHTEATGRTLSETGASIPSIHVDDLKRYFGHTEDFPAKYKRTTGRADLDELAREAGFDDVDNYVEAIQQELGTRSKGRENAQMLRDLRNDPTIIDDARKSLADEKARYGTPETYEPTAKDLRQADKMNRPQVESTSRRVERALDPNDSLQYKNLNPLEKKLYQGEKAKQKVAKLEASRASSEAKRKAPVAQATQSNTPAPQQSQSKQTTPTTQEKQNRPSRQSGQQTPLPENTVQTDRTYTDNTPDIDTTQYVKDMDKSQRQAMKGDNGIKAKASDFKEKFVDDLAPIEDRLNKAIKDGATIDPKDHITYQLDRSRRAEGVMNAYVRDNGLDKIIQNVDNTKEFDQYLIARHAKELDPGVTTGRDAAKDAALVRQLDGKYNGAAKELYKYNQKLLDTSVDYGLISKETAASLKKQYPEYVPFNRIFNEDELANLYGGSGKGDASLSSQNVVKKIKGSNRAIASPLNSIIDKTRVVVEQGERNKAAKMLADYRRLPGNPFNLKEITKNETIGTRHTISYMDKGVKRTFETDKEIADAAKNMTREEIGLWGRIAAVPARVLRSGATTVNVGFAGANVVKDVVGAAINSRHPFRIADPEAFGKALASAFNHNGKYYQELMREGVAGTSFDMYRNPLKSNVSELRSHKNIGTRVAYNVTHPSQWYRTLENTIGRSEDFGRALQYYSNKGGFAKNNSDDVAKILAADQARHNSTNFFRHGSYGKGINLAIPYWNAGVQGARIQVRRIKERPVQTLAKIGFVVAAPSAMIAMNNYASEKNRQVMEDIPQYEKDGNIIIVGPSAKKNDETGRWEGVFKIPVPPQHIGVHKTIQDAVRAGVTGKEFDVLSNLGRVVEDYTTVNPTDAKATASRYVPQALKLVAEPMTNTNFFTGNKIVPDSQKNLPASDQYNEYTSGTAKVIGKIANVSPRQIDNAIRTGMGGAGQNLVKLLDMGLAATGVIDKSEVKGQGVLDSITRRFYGAASINPAEKADEAFGEMKKKITETDAYKNASQYDKGRMLNRLESDINAVAWHVSGKSDSDNKLTKKQQSLLVDGFNTDAYTDLSSSSGVTINKGVAKEHKATLQRYNDMDEDGRKKWFNTENDAEYNYNLAKYENDKANGSLSTADDIRAKRSIYKDKIGSDYSKNTRDLYSLSKADIADYLSTDEKGVDKEKLKEQLLKYDRALYDAGLISYMKFRNGFGSATRRGGGRGGGRRGGTGVAQAKALNALQGEMNSKLAKGIKTASRSLPSSKGATYKKVALKKYAVKKASSAPIKITSRKA